MDYFISFVFGFLIMLVLSVVVVAANTADMYKTIDTCFQHEQWCQVEEPKMYEIIYGEKS